MVVLKRNSYLEYLPNQEENVKKTYDFETEERFQEAMDLLNDWIKKQNHFLVKDYDRAYLEMTLIHSKGSVEKAKKRIDKLCTLRTIMPELLTNIDLRNEFTELKDSIQHCVLPGISKDFYRITIYRLINEEKLDLMQISRYGIASSEYMMANDYFVGYDAILDLQNVGFGIITKLSPAFLQKVMLTLMNTIYGARVRSMHLINASKFVDTLVSILKTGMNEKLRERLQVHSNPESLHKYFDKDTLPSDYGGPLKSVSEFSDDYYKELCSDKFVSTLQSRDGYRTDESKRLGDKFNEEYMGMPGSFRTLNVD